VTIEIRMLGRFEVLADGSPCSAVPWRRRQAAALVKVLALARYRTMHREQLIDVIWPDVPVDLAAPRMHKAAHFARHGFPDPTAAIVLRGDTISLLPDDDVVIDAVVFEQAATDALLEGTVDAAATALAGFGGVLLPDDLYEPWAEQARERLSVLHQQLLRQAGRWEQLLEIDPADEEAHVALMRAHLDRGDRTSALRQFERMDRTMRRELGIGAGPEAAALRDRATAEIATVTATTPQQRQRRQLIGRDAELRTVRRLLESAAAGRGGIALVSGASGVGKTALLNAMLSEARAQGFRTGAGAAAKIEGAWPYAPVLEAINDLCRAHPQVLDHLHENYRAELDRALSLRTVTATDDAGHQRLFVAAAALLRVAAEDAGAMLIVDDVHEADDATLRLLHYLARGAAGDRLLLVVAHRDLAEHGRLEEFAASLARRQVAARVLVQPLDGRATAELVRSVAPNVSDDVARQIWQLAGGLPFASIELARQAADAPAGSNLALAGGFLARLPDHTHELLARVAVAGLAFDTDEFVALSALPDELAYIRLEAALTARIVERTSTGYRFRHALLREELLQRLPEQRRRALHREAASRLATLGASPARVGHHLLSAGSPEEAAPYLLSAAQTEAAFGAYRDALTLVESVRHSVPEDTRGEVELLRGELLAAVGDPAAVDAYREAVRLTSGELRRKARIALSRTATMSGDLESGADALAGLSSNGGPNDVALLLARGNLAYFSGDLDAAAAIAQEARSLIVTGDEQRQLLDLIALQGLVAHNRGEWFQRLSLELQHGRNEPRVAAVVFDSHLCVAEYLLYGPTPYERVFELARALRETAQRAGVLRAVAFATALLGEAALLSGDLDLAETELSEAIDLHSDIDARTGQAHCMQRLAEVRLARGDRSGARDLCERAIPLARWSTLAKHLLQRVYGTLIAAADNPAEAREIVAQAEDVLGRADFCFFCAVMLAVPSATACADVGDIDGAQQHLAMAELSAGLWQGTAWQAAISEARGHLARAERDEARARSLLATAERGFLAAGQPLDAARCASFALRELSHVQG
jgi:DNA-binding SARP family transcriptional activator/tetratricopeptide (TPR) repeat protein